MKAAEALASMQARLAKAEARVEKLTDELAEARRKALDYRGEIVRIFGTDSISELGRPRLRIVRDGPDLRHLPGGKPVGAA